MKFIYISIMVCIFIVASGFNAFGEEWTAEQKEVWEAVEGHWESLKKGDVEALMDDYHDKMLDLDGEYPTPFNKSQIESATKYRIGYYVPTYINLKPIAINIVSNVANVFYVYKWESKNKDYSQSGRTMTTMLKENNKWLSIGSLSAFCNQPAPCPYGW